MCTVHVAYFRRNPVFQKFPTFFLRRFTQRGHPEVSHFVRGNNLTTRGIVLAIETLLHLLSQLVVSDLSPEVPMPFPSSVQVDEERATQCSWIHVHPVASSFLGVAQHCLDFGLIQFSQDRF